MHTEDNVEENQSGLVISDISGRKSDRRRVGFDDVSQAIEQIPTVVRNKANLDKPSFKVTLSPASVKVSMTFPPGKPKVRDYKPKTAITKWTSKSRSNMVAKLLTLDYSPLNLSHNSRPVMITLTYPGEWELVVPTGQDAKRHLYAFKKRLERKLKRPLHGVWKMEFQSRGAVHFHIFTSIEGDIKEFRAWVAESWADIVDHPNPKHRERHRLAGTAVDEGLDFLFDQPQLIGVYFSKHASPNGGVKEYQNQPPQLWLDSESSVGRFWGCWNLKPAVLSAEISYRNAVLISRTLRRWQRANAKPRKKRVARKNKATGKVTYRWVTRKPKRMKGTRGFLAVPDGATMGELLGRVLGQTTAKEELFPQQRREVGNLSVFRLDNGMGDSQLVFKSSDLLRQLDNPCRRTPQWGTGNFLLKFIKVRGVGVEPTHVNQSMAWNLPNSVRNICPSFVQLNLVGFITKLRGGKTRKTHRLSHCVKRLVDKWLWLENIRTHLPLLSILKSTISIIYQKLQK